jgi:hypothetical protein
MPRKISLSGLQIILILAANIVSLSLTEAGNFGTARGQGSLELTPEQKAAICDPNNPSSKLDHVNTTESKICGLPVDPSGTANTTTGAEAPSDALAPSAVPSPPEPEPEPEG